MRRLGPLWEPRRDIRILDEVRSRPAHVESDVRDLDLAGQRVPGREQEAGLQRGERHGALGSQHTLGRRPRQPVDPARDVDGEDRIVSRRRTP